MSKRIDGPDIVVVSVIVIILSLAIALGLGAMLKFLVETFFHVKPISLWAYFLAVEFFAIVVNIVKQKPE